jgi:outer membrane lipase/esterase
MSIVSMRSGVSAAALVASLTLTSLLTNLAPASAQTLSATQGGGRVISFGDSLSDNGNTRAATGNPPAPYFNGRFSNGPTWVELLNGPMNSPIQGTGVAGNVNLAFGGARADNGVNLNGPLPSIGTQVGIFVGNGGTFGAKDLVTMQGGANDIFQYFTLNPAATPPGIIGASTAAANAFTTDVQAAIGAGAKKLLVTNLADIGSTPAYNGSPLSAGAGALASQAYNAQWQQNVVALAAANRGVNIIQADMAALFNVIKANPGAFGITNGTQACTASAACVTGNAAAQNQYLFWDTVHPTSVGQALEARYALLLLNADLTSQAISPLREVAVNGRKQSTDETMDRVAQWGYGVIARQNGAYVQGTGTFANQRQHDNASAYRANSGGIRFGIDKELGNSLVGGGVAVGIGGINSGGYNADVTTFHADAYAAHLMGPFYVSGSVGGSWSSITGRRDTGIATVTANGNTSSSTSNAAVEAGWIVKSNAVSIVPSARLSYIHSSIGAFTETAPILANAYSSQTYDGFIAAARVRAIVPANIGLIDGRVFGEVGYETYLGARNGTFTGSLVNNTALPFDIATSSPVAGGINFKTGLEGKISEAATVTLQYGAALQNGNGVAHTGQARLKVPF